MSGALLRACGWDPLRRVGGMGGGEAVESSSEWPSLPEPGIPRGRPRYTPATPIVPKDPPVAYKLEKGARGVPVYGQFAKFQIERHKS